MNQFWNSLNLWRSLGLVLFVVFLIQISQTNDHTHQDQKPNRRPIITTIVPEVKPAADRNAHVDDTQDLRNPYQEAFTLEMQMSPDDAERFVNHRNRDAASLVAAYDLTGNFNYLEEALETHPSDPRVLITALMDLNGVELVNTKSEKIESLVKSDPENGIGYYLSASDLFDSEDPNEALDLFAEAITYPVNLYEMDRMATTKEAWLHQGKSEIEAKVLAYTRNHQPPVYFIMDTDVMAGHLMSEIKESTQNDDLNTAIDRVELLLGFAANMQFDSPGSLPLEYRATSHVISALDRFDESLGYGADQTVGDARADVMRRQMELSEALSAGGLITYFLDGASEDSLREMIGLMELGQQVTVQLFIGEEVARRQR